MKAICIHEYGDPKVCRLEEVPAADPGAGEARVKLQYAGVNFIDIYHRTGLYKNPLPFTPGMEGAGIVEEVGDQGTGLEPGDRVAFAMHLGCYAETINLPAWKLVPVPDKVELKTAAAVMLQGMTAHYLSHSTFVLDEGKTALVHAAAGATGQLLLQIARMRGSRVIGVVSTEEKATVARGCGADEVIVSKAADFATATRDLTGGLGVDVVYDSVGRSTFEGSLRCLKPRGTLVLFGQSSGAVPPLDPLLLNNHGSLFLTRPSLAHYAAKREELLWRAGDLFNWLAEARLRVHIDRVWTLAQAGDSHEYLASRQAMGKLLLQI